MNVPVLIEYTDSMTNVSLYLQLQGGRREGKLTSGFCFMKFSKAQTCKKKNTRSENLKPKGQKHPKNLKSEKPKGPTS